MRNRLANIIHDAYECRCNITPYGLKTSATLSTLVKESDNFLKKRKNKCVAKTEKVDRKNQRIYFNVVCNESYSKAGGHTVRIRFKKKPLKQGGFVDALKDLDVRVSCSCESYLYWGAQYYSKRDNYQDGAVRGIYKEPTIRSVDGDGNPIGTMYVCKHIATVLQLFNKYILEFEKDKIKDIEGPETDKDLDGLFGQAYKKDKSILEDPEVDKEKDSDGLTPLHVLALMGVDEVLDHKSVGKVKDNEGNTPLHLLAQTGARKVLKHPSVKRVKNKKGETPYQLIEDKVKKELIKKLEKGDI